MPSAYYFTYLIHSKSAKGFMFFGLSLDIIAYRLCDSPDSQREQLEGEGHDGIN